MNYILAVLVRKDDNIYSLYQKLLKCYYDNIASVPDLRVLCINQREKSGLEIFIGESKSMGILWILKTNP